MDNVIKSVASMSFEVGFEWGSNGPSLLFYFRCSGCLVECGLIRGSRWWSSKLVDRMVWDASWPLWSSILVSCQDGLVLLLCDRVYWSAVRMDWFFSTTIEYTGGLAMWTAWSPLHSSIIVRIDSFSSVIE